MSRSVGQRPTKRRSDDPSVRHFNSDAHLVIRRKKKKSQSKKRFLLSSLLKTVFLDSNSMCTVVALRSRIAIARGMGVFLLLPGFSVQQPSKLILRMAYPLWRLHSGNGKVSTGERRWKGSFTVSILSFLSVFFFHPPSCTYMGVV